MGELPIIFNSKPANLFSDSDLGVTRDDYDLIQQLNISSRDDVRRQVVTFKGFTAGKPFLLYTCLIQVCQDSNARQCEVRRLQVRDLSSRQLNNLDEHTAALPDSACIGLRRKNVKGETSCQPEDGKNKKKEPLKGDNHTDMASTCRNFFIGSCSFVQFGHELNASLNLKWSWGHICSVVFLTH